MNTQLRDYAGRFFVLLLCWSQGLLGLAATTFVRDDAEYVYGFAPAMCVVGLLTLRVAIYRGSTQLLIFALTTLGTTGLLLFFASVFGVNAMEGRVGIRMVVVTYTLVTLVWSLVTTVLFFQSPMLKNLTQRAGRFKLSIRSLLIATACICVIVALSEQLGYLEYKSYFTAMYSCIVLGTCIVLGFTQRSNASEKQSPTISEHLEEVG